MYSASNSPLDSGVVMHRDAGYNGYVMLSADEYLRKLQDPLWYGEQDTSGVDLSLIRENLKLTPHERLLRGDRARRSALELLEHGRRQREANAGRQRSGEDRGGSPAP
jgi:hypothetical protein